MWTRSAAAPACSKANWASASQLAPGARRIKARGVAIAPRRAAARKMPGNPRRIGVFYLTRRENVLILGCCRGGTHPPLVRPPGSGRGLGPSTRQGRVAGDFSQKNHFDLLTHPTYPLILPLFPLRNTQQTETIDSLETAG